MTDAAAPPPLADLRKSYELGALDEADAADDPMQQFERWFAQAREARLPEPNAMTLATVGPDERPSTRVVLIKGLDARGIVWYTNYESRKGRELSANPWAALQFHWVEMERQVRIEGRVEPADPDEADRYHASRPLASRIAAWASPQSRVIASRQVLQDLTAEAEARLGSDPPRPPHWGGMRLVPDRWEFWQGRRNRLHDRLRYTARPEGGWALDRLAP